MKTRRKLFPIDMPLSSMTMLKGKLMAFRTPFADYVRRSGQKRSTSESKYRKNRPGRFRYIQMYTLEYIVVIIHFIF